MSRLGGTRNPTERLPTVLFTDRRKMYSRTVPVKLTHSATVRTIIVIVMIDDQLFLTFLDPEVAKNPAHVIESNEIRQTSIVDTPGRIDNGTLLGGTGTINTPSSSLSPGRISLNCNSASPARSDRQYAVRKRSSIVTGLQRYAKYVPQKSKSWKPILLVARDFSVAQQQEQHTSSPNQHQTIAAKTPLGWPAMRSASAGCDPIRRRASTNQHREKHAPSQLILSRPDHSGLEQPSRIDSIIDNQKPLAFTQRCE